jgi:hypothetical protein
MSAVRRVQPVDVRLDLVPVGMVVSTLERRRRGDANGLVTYFGPYGLL